MKVLITGGAGYIGSHCNKYFSQRGIETIVLDNLLFGHKKAVKYGDFIEADFGDRIFLQHLFSQNNFDAVIHFAALADVADSIKNPKLYYETNVSKMLVLINSMIQNNVTKIIFSSSAAIFGEPEYIPIDEKHTKDPINPYGHTKFVGEKMLDYYHEAYGLDFIALRYFNASGADLDGEIGESHNPEHHLLPLIFQTLLNKNKVLNIYGKNYKTKDGTCIRDFIHVCDIAKAHYLALEYLMSGGKSTYFNLGSSTGFSILEIIKTCEKIIEKSIDYNVVERREGDPARLVASNKKIKNILNWVPEYSDIDTIIRTGWQWEQNRKF